MRASAKKLVGYVTLCLTFTAATAFAAPHPVTLGVSTGAIAIGQSGSRGETDQRQQADTLLRDAQRALKDGKLDLADYYITKAEKLNVKYDPVTARYEYTPEKARQELNAARQQNSPGASPSASPVRGGAYNAGPAPADPFALRNRPTAVDGSTYNSPSGGLMRGNSPNPNDIAGDVVDRLPPADSGAFPATRNSTFRENAVTNPYDVEPARGPLAGGNQGEEVQSLLYAARRELALRNGRRAAELTAKVRAAGGTFAPLDDSPEKVDALLRKASQLSAGPTGDNQTEYRRDLAQFLMEQADGLLRYKDYAAATDLAQQAKNVNAEYRRFERTADQLLEQIAAAKSVAGGPASSDRGAFAAAPAASPQKMEAQRLLAQAQAALDRGDLQSASQATQRAAALNVPDTEFAGNEMRPWKMELMLEQAMNRQGGAPMRAGYAESGGQYGAAQGVYDPANDRTRNMPAATDNGPAARIPGGPNNLSAGLQLYDQGLKALDQRDRATALGYFRQAYRYRDQLDAVTRQDLQDKLNLLQASVAEPVPSGKPASPLDRLDEQQRLYYQKLTQEVLREREAAQNMQEKDPRGALQRLQKLHSRVAESQLDADSKRQMLNSVDRNVQEMERYIQEHLAEIENNEVNRSRLQDVESRAVRKIEVEGKVAALVESFNKLVDENRYAEAELVARQAHELAPDLPVVQNLIWQARFVRRLNEQMAIRDRKEQGFYDALTRVEEGAIPFDDGRPIQFGDATEWRSLSDRRALSRERRNRLSPEELRIQQAVNNEKVDVRFNERPLREVLELLGAKAGVNVHLDQQGLHAEGITSDTPITINLNQPITLRSALRLILEDLHLSYVIQNEVVKVTSETMRDENVYQEVYYVADLVIPIPNFVPSYNIGIPGALAAAQNSLGYGPRGPVGGSGLPLSVAANENALNNSLPPGMLASMGTSTSRSSRGSQSIGHGVGGLGGGPQADFDSLIELITTTIAPQSWDEVGGPGSVSGFETNLSLVVSQTQEVHEQLADLLEQLRRLQDLQVTIEVRFITLQDNFFERIGIDFDFKIDDKTGIPANRQAQVIQGNEDFGPTFTIGLDNANGVGIPTADLDIPFNQNSFASAVPAFGGFDAATAANFGFAILSDIEVFFLLQAAQGDQRTNVLNAPKVTLFNGQQAYVSDTSQRPFVTSVIPVVGDFAAAQQPVIVVLNEGTSLSVQAVVSADRRFVRLTLVPFFSSIGDVQEFTFDGKKTTKSASSTVDDQGNKVGSKSNDIETTVQGTTVQLPTFNFTTVTTTVSVPDGGTVLLGGIKRLAEGRNERGVPLLNKVPYVSRLFKNVGIGRETRSLMMMVTPRIIIQEEEEKDQTGLDSAQLSSRPFPLNR